MVNILLVEDDPSMQRLYTRTFQLEGVSLMLAVNGYEALRKITELRPSIILMDIMMPVMNGLEALSKIKANPSTKDIPVIILSNLARKEEEVEAKRLEASRYIVKSDYEPSEVVQLVKEVLQST